MTAIDLVLHLLQASNEWRLVEITYFVGRAQYKSSLKLREKKFKDKFRKFRKKKKLRSSSEELQDIANKMQRSSHQNLHYSINFRIKKKKVDMNRLD